VRCPKCRSTAIKERPELGIVPTVRHADYIGVWLEVLRVDNRAAIRAPSAASKATDFLLAFRTGAADAQIGSEKAAW
jgi:antirestriction protein ArdC